MQAGARRAARPAAPPGRRAAPRARGRARAPRAALPGADLAPRPAAADPAALAFLDEATGERIPAMPADYGFRSGSGRLYQDGYGGVPRPALALAAANFRDEAAALRRAVRLGDEPDAAGDAAAAGAAGAAGRALAAVAGAARRAAARADAWLEARGVLGSVPAAPAPPGGPVPPAAAAVLDAVRALTLDDRAVARREAAREAAEGAVAAPAPIRLAYGMLIWSIDVLYAGRPIQRFWFLETVRRARPPSPSFRPFAAPPSRAPPPPSRRSRVCPTSPLFPCSTSTSRSAGGARARSCGASTSPRSGTSCTTSRLVVWLGFEFI
jgi:hypothetical protein